MMDFNHVAAQQNLERSGMATEQARAVVQEMWSLFEVIESALKAKADSVQSVRKDSEADWRKDDEVD